MSSNNPTITVSDLIEEVDTRLGGTNLDTSDFLPWASYSQLKTYNAIIAAGQQAKERYFETEDTLDLSTSVLEIDITSQAPDFGSVVKIEVKYGASGDDWNPASKMASSANWRNLHNVSTTYRNKTSPVYNITGDSNLMVIPIPPEDGAQAYIRYISRPYKLTLATDTIVIPYRFTYLMTDYIYNRATIAENEDISAFRALDADFEAKLRKLTEEVTNEFNENDGTSGIRVSGSAPIFRNPLMR